MGPTLNPTASGVQSLDAAVMASIGERALGMRVMPPTRRTSLISLVETPASLMQSLHGCRVRFSSGSVSCSNLPRVSVMLRCLAPARMFSNFSASNSGRRQRKACMLSCQSHGRQSVVVTICTPT